MKNTADLEVTDLVTYDTSPSKYCHWKLSIEKHIATLSMDVTEGKGFSPGYELKLNSYDLGVDIELYDALNRIRFEHPEVKCVVITSSKEKMFCSGANIYMLGKASHSAKVNFCKFTNETRNGIEDSSLHEGLKFLAAVNGTVAGGGYELALACDKILMIDDRSSSVSLPEVPMLGVLPGTGGLTRVVDKRKVRKDHADVFCSLPEGFRALRAKKWNLVDEICKPKQFLEKTNVMAEDLSEASNREGSRTEGVRLEKLDRVIDENGYHYNHVKVSIDTDKRVAFITVHGPKTSPSHNLEEIMAEGCSWWLLELARELDDAILLLRTNNLDIGVWVLKTKGDARNVIAIDQFVLKNINNWFVRSTIGFLRRTFARLEVSARSLFAIVDSRSCFAGTLTELLLAADRSYMLCPEEPSTGAPTVQLSKLNFGFYPMINDLSRIESRFCEDKAKVSLAEKTCGQMLSAKDAEKVGLVTFIPDELDWDEEIRLALEERVSISPDALTGMEANLRFSGKENTATRVFGRLSAWQNWIFNRPNAVGPAGALKTFGTGKKPEYKWERV